jgi:recombinational DNA repair protein (RecF pathway)
VSTVYLCAGCGTEMERYEDDGPYIERAECLCSKCFGSSAAFDAALDAYETNQYLDDAAMS